MQYSIPKDKLLTYTRQMILIAIKNHRSDVITLLENSGMDVPADVDDKTLHAMVLKAMMISEPFKTGFTSLLHTIAMEGQYSKYGGTNYASMDAHYANQTGAATTNIACVKIGCNTSCCGTSLGDYLSPDVVKGLLTTGLGILNSSLSKGGNAAINKEVNTPPVAPKATGVSWGTIAIVTLVVAGGVFAVYKYKHRK